MTWRSDAEFQRFVDSRPVSPAGAELDRRHEAIDPDGQAAKLSFAAADHHRNPKGDVQGGFILAMLDEAMTEAVVLATDGKFYIPTLSMQAQYLEPAGLGRQIAIGRVRRLGRSTAFLEGALYDESETTLLVSASAVVALTPVERLRASRRRK